MKKYLSSIPLKVSAILTSYVMMIVLAVSVVSVLIMGYCGFYFSSKQNIKNDILGSIADGKAYRMSKYDDIANDVEYVFSNSNFFYTIERLDGETVVSNYDGEDIMASGQFYGEEYIYTVYIPWDLPGGSDEISMVNWLIDVGYALRYWFIVFGILSVVGIIALLCYLYCSAGHKEGFEGIRCNYLDLIPTDIYFLFTVFIYMTAIAVIAEFFFEGLEVLIVGFALGTVLYFLGLGFTMSVATRIKTRTLFKNTIIYRVARDVIKLFKKIGKSIGYLIKKLPLIWKTVTLIAIVLLAEFIYLLLFSWESGMLGFGFVLFNFFAALAVIYVALVLQRIKEGGDKIANGELEHKIDTKYMVLDFKDFSEKLNSINDGMQIAVNEKMKSELFKTELITNVSHDIKTPLTSIINYVDLLKKEDIENVNAKECIGVLDRQSERLKKLIEDLVEASKASTGNLKVNLAPCDIGVLLSQTVGEFDERFQKATVTPLLNIPNKNVIIRADARHLWRVIDNLLNNICKYSQGNTRAYIDVTEQNGKAVVTFKNISRYQLNISSDELMERFVRGDKSRHTEGSGLGLSIAKSLTEIQNGQMDIDVDGDLFKVSLTFDTVAL